MSHHIDHKEHKHGSGEGHGATKHGPIISPMEEVFGNPEDFDATGGGVYDGLNEPYQKGTPTEAREIAFDNCGAFGKVPKENK